MLTRLLVCSALFAAFAAQAAEPFDCADLAAAEAKRAALKPKLEELDPAEGEEVWNQYVGDDLLGKEAIGRYALWLFLNRDAAPCATEDPVIGAVNHLAAWDRKTVDAEGYAAAVLKDPMGPLALFALTAAAKGDAPSLPADLFKKFESTDLTLTVLSRLFRALNDATPKTAELIGAAMANAPMNYFDFLAEKTVALLAERPGLVAAHLATWQKHGDFFAGALAMYATPEQYEAIQAHWTAQPDGPAKTAVHGWIATANEYEG